MRKLLTTVAVASGMLFTGGIANAADTTVTVYGAGGNWTATNASGSSGAVVSGPAGVAAGTGSFRMSTPSATDVTQKTTLFTSQFNSVNLADIDGLGYTTYRDSPAFGSASLASLQLRLQFAPGNSGMLAYEPYWTTGNNSILNGQWQSWDAFTGRWWTSRVSSGPCSADNPCTLTALKTMFPSAKLSGSSFGINQGTYNLGTVSYVDSAYISVLGNKTTFDFDPDTTKPVCGSMVITRGTGGAKDYAEVTITDAGVGIASITSFTVNNGTATIPTFSQGAASVKVRATKTTQGQSTFFEFDVTDRAGNTTHCV